MEMNRICLIHLNQIGDLVFSLPFLKALRERYPEAEIHSILRPHLQELLTHSPYVDRLIYRGNGIKEKLRLIREIRQSRQSSSITIMMSNHPNPWIYGKVLLLNPLYEMANFMPVG